MEESAKINNKAVDVKKLHKTLSKYDTSMLCFVGKVGGASSSHYLNGDVTEVAEAMYLALKNDKVARRIVLEVAEVLKKEEEG